MKNNKTYLSLVIPAYNEENNIRTGALASVYEYLKEQDYTWEVIVVDDGSTDFSVSLIQKFLLRHNPRTKDGKFKLLRRSHRGKGAAVISGMLEAQGEIIVFDDMDQATPIDQLEKVLPKFKEGYDIVIGSRVGREGAPFIRKLMAYGFALLRNIVLLLPYKDTQCGFKAFKFDASRKIFEKMKIFSEKNGNQGASVTAGFDLEILYIARKLGLKVIEVPVNWHHKEGTKVNPVKDSYEGLRDLLLVRINAFRGLYK